MKIIAMSIILLSLFLSWLYSLIISTNRKTQAKKIELPCYPKVSILIALRNVDDGLEKNMESIFRSDYPDFDIHFATDTMEDQCVGILLQVCNRFPDIKSFITAEGHTITGNPKIHKLSRIEKACDGKLFWILDSDIRIEHDTLKRTVAEYVLNDAKVVFGPIRCRGAKTFGSVMEMCNINHFLSGSVLAVWKFLGKRVVIGKSILVERASLDKFGGFGYFSDVLSEDYWIGETFAASGFNVRCSDVWVDNIKESSSIKTFFDRMARWAKLRFNLNRSVYVTEILQHPIPLAIIMLPLLQNLAAPAAVAAVFLRIASEYATFFALNRNGHIKLSTVLEIAPAVIVKDLLLFIVYFVPFFSRSIVWRGGSIKIGKHTLIGFNTDNLLYDGA
jgi:cellulose synthase/poly-beta-1,6-N-acetylglucosamine synthase-like glycosyltransferase